MAELHTTRLAPSLCPHCGYLLDAATATRNEKASPKPGDFTICLECAEVLTFDAQLRPVMPPLGWAQALALESPQTLAMLRHAQATARTMPKRPSKVPTGRV